MTVRKFHSMECPKCHSDEAIVVIVEIQVLLLPDGVDAQSGDGQDEDFSDENIAMCGACGEFEGKVKDFIVKRAA